MLELLAVSIGLGLVVSLLFGELFGIAAGGMVVPGYFALYLQSPVDVGLTLGAAVLTFAIVQGLAQVAIIYGRRRTALTILVGYLIGIGVRWAVDSSWSPIEPSDLGDGTLIGFIIPGLIAIWYQRQGVVETTLSLLSAAVAVRMMLIVALGDIAI